LRDPGTPLTRSAAWIATIVLVALTVLMQAGVVGLGTAEGKEDDAVEKAKGPLAPNPVFTLQARFLVAASGALSRKAGADDADDVDESGSNAALAAIAPLRSAAQGSPEDTLHLAIVEGEIVGPSAALDTLDEVVAQDTAAPAWLHDDAASLRTIYGAGGADALTDAQRKGLLERHGWFGRLALTFGKAPNDPARARALGAARRASVALATLTALATGGVIAGLVLLVLVGVGYSHGRLRSAYSRPAPGGSVFLETFALFLVAFLALSSIAGVVEATTGVAVTPILMWLILPVAFWPMARGVSWDAWRHAAGWHRGRGVLREIGAGVIGYVAGLPVLALGIGLTLALIQLWSLLAPAGEAGGGAGPVHPIVGEAQGATAAQIASIYLLGVVWAPIVEETFFRGCLFHHLRGKLSPVLASLVVGFIFAVIHPQGILAVPAIASLGFVFSMIREWRGSIIANATAHALNNAVLLTTVVVALR